MIAHPPIRRTRPSLWDFAASMYAAAEEYLEIYTQVAAGARADRHCSQARPLAPQATAHPPPTASKKTKAMKECGPIIWSCAYHSCTSNHCQFEEMKKTVGAQWVRRCDPPDSWHLELCKRCKWSGACPIGYISGLDYVAMECLCKVKFPEKYITLFPNERKFISL